MLVNWFTPDVWACQAKTGGATSDHENGLMYVAQYGNPFSIHILSTGGSGKKKVNPDAVCGNSICEEGEDYYSCGLDCVPAPQGSSLDDGP